MNKPFSPYELSSAAQVGADAYIQIVMQEQYEPLLGSYSQSELQSFLFISNEGECIQPHRFDLAIAVGIGLSIFQLVFSIGTDIPGISFATITYPFLSSNPYASLDIFLDCEGGINAPPGQYYTGERLIPRCIDNEVSVIYSPLS